MDGLLAVLDLVPGPDGEDVFLGRTQPQPWGRIFGGQLLAQALVAAARTVPGDRPVHAMHACFLRPGNDREPVSYGVERLRDGRSFSAREVRARQAGRTVLSALASFQVPGPGPEHQPDMPDVPGPESLPTLAERFAGLSHPGADYWTRHRPVDLRHVEGPVFLDAGAERTPRQAVWMRAVGRLPDDPGTHAAALALASDYTVLEPVLRRHGVPWVRPGLRVASLDHALWWHGTARADEWLLFVQESPAAGNARGLGTGRFFTRDGALVCTVAQEGMFRVPR
ncbi:MAG: acyl-CoA thioesterase II [Actinomycetales bacterium]|nr:acyl-CoA thioesterase II [Actinomycetales bacterium]